MPLKPKVTPIDIIGVFSRWSRYVLLFPTVGSGNFPLVLDRQIMRFCEGCGGVDGHAGEGSSLARSCGSPAQSKHVRWLIGGKAPSARYASVSDSRYQARPAAFIVVLMGGGGFRAALCFCDLA